VVHSKVIDIGFDIERIEQYDIGCALHDIQLAEILDTVSYYPCLLLQLLFYTRLFRMAASE